MEDPGEFFALTGLAAAEFAGEQTDEFLQGQLTADVAGLPSGKWLWSGYCTPKGKLLCTALIWRCREQKVGLVMAADLVADIVGRLRMYVLRARTGVRIMEEGIAGRLACRQPEESVETLKRGWSLAVAGGLELRVGEPAASDPEGERQWWARWLAAGAPLIGAAVSEKLTPQMASLDLAGGVSFTKGCYVGQEIVARTRHLGRVKRRAYLIEGAGAPPHSGSDLLLPSLRDQAGGVVIRAVAGDEGFVGLASLRTDAADGQLKLADERPVKVREPAYGIGAEGN